ncbi:hypothetical protein [Escherichia coli]|uniref:hypothetical protein n=1 Tax=Escherichia coli TaxID=562 RepID=UPI00312CA89B
MVVVDPGGDEFATVLLGPPLGIVDAGDFGGGDEAGEQVGVVSCGDVLSESSHDDFLTN